MALARQSCQPVMEQVHTAVTFLVQGRDLAEVPWQMLPGEGVESRLFELSSIALFFI